MTAIKVVLGDVGPKIKAVVSLDGQPKLVFTMRAGFPGRDGAGAVLKVNGTPYDASKSMNLVGEGVSASSSGGNAEVDFVYSGQFKGHWDMSSGTSGPAAPATDYYATPADTTITPAATLGGTGPLFLSASASKLILRQPSGTADATFVVPHIAGGDTVLLAILAIVNSGATLADIEDVINGRATVNPAWFGVISVNLAGIAGRPVPAFGHYNNDILVADGTGICGYGDTLTARFDFAANTLAMIIGGSTAATASIDFAAMPADQAYKLVAGIVSTSSDVVFSDGILTVDFSGFNAVADAVLPDGALDLDEYEVSAGGYFHGKTTRPGQFVKLIRGMTDLEVIADPNEAVRSVNGKTPDADGAVSLSAGDVLAIAASEKAAANGVASLGADGTLVQNLDASRITSGVIDSARLPSYVDDVLEFANLAAFPAVGESGKVYIALDTDISYRWTGSAYRDLKGDAAGVIHAAASKTMPADADELPIVDSAASNILKKLTFANLAAWLYNKLANITGGFLGLVYVGVRSSAPAASSNSGKFAIFTETGWLFRSNGTCWDRVGGGPVVKDAIANIIANYNATTYDGCVAVATDWGVPGVGVELVARSGNWTTASTTPVFVVPPNIKPSGWYINCNPSGATYSQSGTTLTLTWASHGIPSSLNGANIYLAPSSGAAAAGWYSNITVTNADTITCTSTASMSTSGNIGSNSVDTYLPTLITFPAAMIRAGVYVNAASLHYAKVSATSKSFKYFGFSGQIGATANLTTSGRVTALNLGAFGSGLRFSTDTNWFFTSDTSILQNTISNTTLRAALTCASANDWNATCTEYVSYYGG